MGFMNARTSAPSRIAPKTLPPPTDDPEAAAKTADELFNMAESLRAGNPIATADHLWGLADDAAAAVGMLEKEQQTMSALMADVPESGRVSPRPDDGPTQREKVEAKLGATVKAAMSAVATASAVMSQAKRVSKVDVPREVAKAVREAKADAMVAQLEAVEDARQEVKEEYDRTIEEKVMEARANIKQEVIKLADEKTQNARKVDRKKHRDEMEAAKAAALEAQKEAITEALAEQERDHQIALSFLQSESENTIEAQEQEAELIAAAAREGLAALAEGIGAVLADVDASVEDIKEQELAAQAQNDLAKAELQHAHNVMERELTEALEWSRAETAAAIAAHEQQIRDAAAGLALAVEQTRAIGVAAKVRALSLARAAQAVASQQAAEEAAAALAAALDDAAQQAATIQQEAVAAARHEEHHAKKVAVAEAKALMSMMAREEATAAANKVASQAAESAVSLAITQAREAATFEAKRDLGQQHEADLNDVAAAWEERLNEAHDNAHAWAQRAEELAAAEQEALQQLARLQSRLDTIMPIELTFLRIYEFFARIVGGIAGVFTRRRPRKQRPSAGEQMQQAPEAVAAGQDEVEEDDGAGVVPTQDFITLASPRPSSARRKKEKKSKKQKKEIEATGGKKGVMTRQATWNRGLTRSNTSWLGQKVPGMKMLRTRKLSASE